MKTQSVIIILRNVILLGILLSILVRCSSSKSEKDLFNDIEIGDSLFMKSPTERKPYIHVGNIQRVEINSQDELRRLNYLRKDTLGFKSNGFSAKDAEECFYKSGSTFIGFCIGKDSIQTEYGVEYLAKIKPSECLNMLMNKSYVYKYQEPLYVNLDGAFLKNKLTKD